MRAHFGLPSVSSEDHMGVSANAKAPISVQFEIPYFTVSGIQVRYLKVRLRTPLHALHAHARMRMAAPTDGTGCCAHEAARQRQVEADDTRCQSDSGGRGSASHPPLCPLRLFCLLLCLSLVQIIEKSGYQALPWVRYITQNGDYQIRMS